MDVELLNRKLTREKKARQAAEALLEKKSRELYDANEKLKRLVQDMEQRIEDRTREFLEARDRARDAEKIAREATAALEQQFQAANVSLDDLTERAQRVTAVSEDLEGCSQTMRSAVSGSQRRAAHASLAGEEVAAAIQSVAGAAEEMSISVTRIEGSVREVAGVAKDATKMAKKASDSVQKLDVASESISVVVEDIATIAHQTNLLALNATIEAARAGDAGRGFAVVASEVKALSRQTAKATDDIVKYVGDIRSRTTEAVSVIGRIVDMIETLHGLQAGIAISVNEQTAATREISRSAIRVANETTTISATLKDLESDTASAAGATEEVVSHLLRLNAISDELRLLGH